jgi:HNH endonuclease
LIVPADPAPVMQPVGPAEYRDGRGRRCSARERLEFHHVVPFGQGGDHSAENIRLACSSHDRYQAELDYGAAFVAARARQRGARERLGAWVAARAGGREDFVSSGGVLCP